MARRAPGQSRLDIAVAPSEPAALARRAEELALATTALTVDAARAMSYAAALGWWEANVRAAGGEPSRITAAPAACSAVELPPGLSSEAAAFGQDLIALPAADAVAELGRLYTHSLSDDHRSRHGIFYTPPALVRRLLDKSERAGHDWLTGRAIDPSSGGGAFLVEAAKRMVAALGDTNPAIVVAAVSTRLLGWDIDKFACWLAQLAAESVLLDKVISSGRRLPVVVECRDSLKAFETAKGRFDLVMGNPAFGKLKKTPEIGRKFARSLYGHPNLYGMLTDVAVHLAKPQGGVIAYLTPASYLGGEYFKALRKVLVTEAKPVSIDIVESRADVFADVLQEVALTCLKRGRVEDWATCSVARVAPHGLLVEQTGVLTLPENPEEPWILPRSARDASLVAQIAKMRTRLRHWGYHVSTGPLVWNRHKDRLSADGGPGRFPVIWAESVTADGRFSLRASKANHRDRAWFTPAGAKDPNLVRKACVLAQRTTAKEQNRRIVCAVMPHSVLAEYGAVAVENHLNMIIPISARPKVPLTALATFFSAAAADRAIRCINGSVALSASELEAMPLPPVDDLMAALGGRDPESAVRRLYGIRDEPSAAVALRRDPGASETHHPRGHTRSGIHRPREHGEDRLLCPVHGGDRGNRPLAGPAPRLPDD